MRALTWQGRRHVDVREVPDPVIQEPTDAIVRVTSSAICGSDLHLYELLGPFLDPADILGHEAMGIVETTQVTEGTVSISGVYAGDADVLPMKTMFDKQLSLRMGQCSVKRWVDDLLPLVEDDADPLGTEDLVTHRAELGDAAARYETFQKKADGCVKVVLQPGTAR